MKNIIQGFKGLPRKIRNPDITYQEENGTLLIRDGQQENMLLIKIVLFINLANSFLLGALPFWQADAEAEMGMGIFWALVGAGSAVLLLLMQFSENTYQEQIPINQIESWEEWTVLGVKNQGLSLKNGKRRSFNPLLRKMPSSTIKEKLKDIGIPGMDGAIA